MTTPPEESSHTTESTGENDPDAFEEALGRIIKVIRTDMGLERGELADRAGISYSYLAAIENGQRRPSSVVLRSLAEALGMRTHELVGTAEARMEQSEPRWTGKPSAQRQPPQQFYGRMQGPLGEYGTDEIASLAAMLEPSDRRLVLALIQRLLRRDGR
jgi:transcriptional regulator with XRE-family HTH domain